MKRGIAVGAPPSERKARIMGRPPTWLILLGGAAAAVALGRHLRGAHSGRRAPGGVLIGDPLLYDLHTRLLLGSFFRGIAADVAAVAPHGARVLEVGCGPGTLSIRLAREHGLDVTGVDLDPAMIRRARANAARAGDGYGRSPSFLIGDVASLAFPDASFDLAVSTLSMHHWADPRAGLTEIGRVLRPGGRALLWDIRPGVLPFHRRVPDPVERVPGSSLRPLRATPWRWPGRISVTQRIELLRSDG